MSVIQPTVGRVLWFFPGGKSALESGQQPCKADIAFVHSPNRINIGYLTHEGQAQSATGVHLVQHGEPPTEGPFCTWMPYQQGQAAKTEAAEAALKKE